MENTFIAERSGSNTRLSQHLKLNSGKNLHDFKYKALHMHALNTSPSFPMDNTPTTPAHLPIYTTEHWSEWGEWGPRKLEQERSEPSVNPNVTSNVWGKNVSGNQGGPTLSTAEKDTKLRDPPRHPRRGGADPAEPRPSLRLPMIQEPLLSTRETFRGVSERTRLAAFLSAEAAPCSSSEAPWLGRWPHGRWRLRYRPRGYPSRHPTGGEGRGVFRVRASNAHALSATRAQTWGPGEVLAWAPEPQDGGTRNAREEEAAAKGIPPAGVVSRAVVVRRLF